MKFKLTTGNSTETGSNFGCEVRNDYLGSFVQLWIMGLNRDQSILKWKLLLYVCMDTYNLWIIQMPGIKFSDIRRIPKCGGIQPILYHYMVRLSFVEQEESDLFCLMAMGYT